MARHLIIGAEAAATVTAATGAVAAGGVMIQKESADGPTALVIGESVADAPRIRFAQGHASGNRFSPWVDGRNIVNWSGASYAAPTANLVILDVATQSNVAGFINLKFVRIGGTYPEFFHLSVSIANARSAANQAADIIAAYDLAVKPDWLIATVMALQATDQVHFQGNVRGGVTSGGGTFEEGPSAFSLIMEENTVGASVYTFTQDSTQADPGSGDGNLILKMEQDLQGISAGYYNRIQLPNAPAAAALTATTYDMWSIVATKDGSTSSSINGVDNLIEITIANDAGSGANALAFENAMNAYCGSTGFAPVVL